MSQAADKSRADAVGRKRILGNTAWLTASSVFTRTVAYFQFLLAVKAFTEDQVGIYAVCLTCVLFAELLANLGLDRVVLREVARMGREASRQLFESSLSLKLAASFLAYALALGGFKLIYPEIFASYKWPVTFFLAYVPIAALARSFESHFTALERMAVPAFSQFFERLVMLAAALAAWFGWIGFGAFLALFPLAGMMRIAYPAAFFLKERGRHPFMLTAGQSVGLLSESSWMFAVEIVAVAYFRVDIFMLSKMADLRATAYYQTAYKIFDFFIAMFSGYLVAIFPAMSRQNLRIRPAMLALGSATVFVCFSLPVILFGEDLLRLFKPEYAVASPVLTCLMCALPLVYANSMLANFAVVAAKVRILCFIALPMLAVNVGLNFYCIPLFGILGSAMATLGSEILLGGALILALKPFNKHTTAHPPSPVSDTP